MIRIATVFSGIGAPEEALKQLHINFETVFACDNGERELMQTVKDSNGKALKDENGKIIKEEITYDKIIEQTKGLSNEDLQNYIVRLYNDTKKPNLVKKSYFANNKIKESQWYEDIRFIDGSKYKNKIDLLIGGSPCQSFSTYGKKLGLDDTRGTLFYNYAKLILDAQPKVFIYENVPGLKTHDGGKTWKTIWNVFDNFPFKIHKGDILAISNGFDIDLANIDTLSNRPSIFSIRPDDNAVDSIRVDLFEGGDKINIWLKRDLHEQYQELEKEPTIKLMLSSYFVMPALIEALNFINQGNSTTNSDEYELAKERGWFQAINNRLIGLGIELSDINSMTTIANKLLSDIVCESMGCLRKIKDNILTGDTSGEG